MIQIWVWGSAKAAVMIKDLGGGRDGDDAMFTLDKIVGLH